MGYISVPQLHYIHFNVATVVYDLSVGDIQCIIACMHYLLPDHLQHTTGDRFSTYASPPCMTGDLRIRCACVQPPPRLLHLTVSLWTRGTVFSSPRMRKSSKGRLVTLLMASGTFSFGEGGGQTFFRYGRVVFKRSDSSRCSVLQAHAQTACHLPPPPPPRPFPRPPGLNQTTIMAASSRSVSANVLFSYTKLNAEKKQDKIWFWGFQTWRWRLHIFGAPKMLESLAKRRSVGRHSV